MAAARNLRTGGGRSRPPLVKHAATRQPPHHRYLSLERLSAASGGQVEADPVDGFGGIRNGAPPGASVRVLRTCVAGNVPMGNGSRLAQLPGLGGGDLPPSPDASEGRADHLGGVPL